MPQLNSACLLKLNPQMLVGKRKKKKNLLSARKCEIEKLSSGAGVMEIPTVDKAGRSAEDELPII